MKYAFDSNAVMHLINGNKSIIKNRDNARQAGAHFVIPPIVNYEVLRGLIIKAEQSHNEAYTALRENCTIGEMTQVTWERAADIYASLSQKHKVPDADILIAAYCMENNCTLVTGNVDDFKNISGLKYVNWVE